MVAAERHGHQRATRLGGGDEPVLSVDWLEEGPSLFVRQRGPFRLWPRPGEGQPLVNSDRVEPAREPSFFSKTFASVSRSSKSITMPSLSANIPLTG